MSWIDRLEPKMRGWAIPNLTLVIVVGSAVCFIFGSFNPPFLATLPLMPERVMQGEVWRLMTFIFYPLDTHPFFAFFTYYLFYIMGTALETAWGEFKYTLYVVLSCLATAAFSFFSPASVTTNYFIGSSIFLAFAFLFPDFQLYFFFVIPVKVKYIAMVTWALFVWFFIAGDLSVRLSLAASVGNFLLFFGGDILALAAASRGRKPVPLPDHEPVIANEEEPFHTCVVCGVNEWAAPRMDFRVCSQCRGGREYCADHLGAHVHETGQ